MRLLKLTNEQHFKDLRVGESLLILWRVSEGWNKDMVGKKLYKVVDKKKHIEEIILQVKGNIFFNYKLYLRGEGVAEEVYAILD